MYINIDIGCLKILRSENLSIDDFKKKINISPKIIGSVGTNTAPIGVSKFTDKGTKKAVNNHSFS